MSLGLYLLATLPILWLFCQLDGSDYFNAPGM